MPAEPRAVLIEGAGIAGQTLRAELAKLGLRASIRDNRTFPRDKVCGGVLQPDSWRYLRETFGVDCPHASLDSISHFWRGRRIARHRLDEPLVFAARIDLDSALWHGAAPAVSAVPGTAGAETLHVRASGVRAGGDGEWIGFQADAPAADGLEMHYGRGIYAGICATPGRAAHAAFLVRRDLCRTPDRMRDFVQSELGLALEGPLKGTTRIRYGYSGQTLAVGDAMLTTHPFLGLGMKHAILSSQMLARLLAEGRENEYPSRHRRAFRRMHWASRAGEMLFQTPLRAAVWPVLASESLFKPAYAGLHGLALSRRLI